MNNERIQSALQGAKETRRVVIGSGTLSAARELYAECFGSQPAILIADENTYAAAGKAVQEQFQNLAAGQRLSEPFIFPGRPTLYADYANVLKLEAALRASAAIPLVVGSGTLNDITKLAAHRCGRPYMVVATAASMDGYTAFGAAITRDGFKQTMACPAPAALLADPDILALAPPEMAAAGYADLLGKITAGADWLVADALAVEPVNPQVWPLVQDSLRAWTAEPHLLRQGSRPALGRLIEGLVLTGLAMQASQSSRPASGSEHQFSHLWEMQNLAHGAISHGFKVGIGSIASAALYERLLQRDLSALDIPAICRAWPTWARVEEDVRQAHANPVLAEKALEQSLAKYRSPAQVGEHLELLRPLWPDLQARLKAQLLPAAELRDQLQAAGCPTHPAEIGLDLARLKASYFQARQIRSRFTIFDLAAEAGCFEACVAELFAPGGFWAAE